MASQAQGMGNRLSEGDGGEGVIEDKASRKPLGIKNYGTIPHLEGSRVTPADKHCHEGQARIATERRRDRHDEIIVTEKVDGSNVGIALWGGHILALTRAGYLAHTSPYEQHWRFADWVERNTCRFRDILEEGERLVGEWLLQAHGTRYNLWHEPFIVIDLMVQHERLPYEDLVKRVKEKDFVLPYLLHKGDSISIDAVLNLLGQHGFHGAIDDAEGVVWKVERRGKVDFLVKYVRPYKLDGIYLPEITGQGAIWNSEVL